MEDFHRTKPSKVSLVGERYELGEEIGRGAFGQVFKATCVKDGSVVAIKQISLSGMSPDRLVDIMQEIDLLKKLNHENIVKYIESFKTRSHLHIVLEYMEQGALSQLIRRLEPETERAHTETGGNHGGLPPRRRHP